MFIPTEPPVGCFIVLLCIVPTTTTFDDAPPKFILPVVWLVNKLYAVVLLDDCNEFAFINAFVIWTVPVVLLPILISPVVWFVNKLYAVVVVNGCN